MRRMIALVLLMATGGFSAPTAMIGQALPTPQAGQAPQVPQAPSNVNEFGTVSVKRISVAEIDASHARLAVETVVTARRGVNLENMRLSELRINELPVYAEPLNHPIELLVGKQTALPTIYVTIQLRDLTSTEPLRQMIDKQMAHVAGRMVADLRVGFLDKLIMHNEHPRVSLPLSQDVPVTFGTTPFARQAAIGVLTMIDFGIKGTAAVRKNLPGFESAWAHELEAEANQNLYVINSRYMLKKSDAEYPMMLDQLGFRLASGVVVTTAEVKNPWEYDAEFLGRMKSGEVEHEKNTEDVRLRMLDGALPTVRRDSELALSQGDFTLDVRGEATKDTLIVQKTPKGRHDDDANGKDTENPRDFAKIHVRRRTSPESVAVIQLRTPVTQGGFHLAPPAILAQDHWTNVAVYRLVFDEDSGRSSVQVVELSAHLDGQQIHLDQPVDASFYGSPILAPEGVIGFVQDEQAGAFLPANLIPAAGSNP
jgi:hypothetical protein